MTAMLIARLLGFTFWEEFWFEYGIGYLLGWFPVPDLGREAARQRLADGDLKRRPGQDLLDVTVMTGLGLVMYYVSPAVVRKQPLPNTYAFWTFGALGLMVRFIVTYPMNWWLVSIGWKHGRGHAPMLNQMDQERQKKRVSAASEGKQRLADAADPGSRPPHLVRRPDRRPERLRGLGRRLRGYPRRARA